jgi:hypothetical protein
MPVSDEARAAIQMLMDGITAAWAAGDADLLAQGVKRVIAVSSGGRGRARNAEPISALHAMEVMIEKNGR